VKNSPFEVLEDNEDLLCDSSKVFDLATQWFRNDVAGGDALNDTIKLYLCHFKQYLVWCMQRNVKVISATPACIEQYRYYLLLADASYSTIALKLTVIRRFYQCAVDRSIIKDNPADKIRPPLEPSGGKSKVMYLSADEAELLFGEVRGTSLRSLRDRALLLLMIIEGLRSVEIVRMNIEDVLHSQDQAECKILVHGRGRDGYFFPRHQTIAALKEYLSQLGPVPTDTDGVPLFLSISKAERPQRRLSRIGLASIITKYLSAIGVKEKGKSCSALRNTCGYLVYQETKDIGAVLEVLRSLSIAPSERFSYIENKAKNISSEIKIKVICD